MPLQWIVPGSVTVDDLMTVGKGDCVGNRLNDLELLVEGPATLGDVGQVLAAHELHGERKACILNIEKPDHGPREAIGSIEVVHRTDAPLEAVQGLAEP